MTTNMSRKNTLLPGLLVAGLCALAGIPAGAQGNGRPSGPAPGGAATVIALSANEAKDLAYMREEEKMARDIYRKLHGKWNLRVFDRIAESEQRHFDAVGRLLTRANVEDPAAGLTEGVFADPKLQTLYNELLLKGESSLKDALEVGVLIEKTDIADLETAITTVVNTEVKRMYTSLLQGSMNHLEAFESCLEILN